MKLIPPSFTPPQPALHSPHCRPCLPQTYDYTHCIIDSLEDITHSLCTLEFKDRQAPDGSYYWLLDALDIYRPQTWEYSRLYVTTAITSKRRLNKLVTARRCSLHMANRANPFCRCGLFLDSTRHV